MLVEILIKDFLDEWVANVVKLLEKFFDQVLGEKVDRTIVLEVVLEKELLVFMFDEVFGVTLPRAEINL